VRYSSAKNVYICYMINGLASYKLSDSPADEVEITSLESRRPRYRWGYQRRYAEANGVQARLYAEAALRAEAELKVGVAENSY
jgi:hypothetical protein